jgi:hypothetical protein
MGGGWTVSDVPEVDLPFAVSCWTFGTVSFGGRDWFGGSDWLEDGMVAIELQGNNDGL